MNTVTAITAFIDFQVNVRLSSHCLTDVKGHPYNSPVAGEKVPGTNADIPSAPVEGGGCRAQPQAPYSVGVSLFRGLCDLGEPGMPLSS